jgi:hypothetical protein
MAEEISVVTPPSIERSGRMMVRNRVYKTFPRSGYEYSSSGPQKHEGASEPSTPSTASSESKAAASTDDLACLCSPATMREKANRVNITMTHYAKNSTAAPHVVRMEDEDRMAENDVPFDQASDAAARDASTTSAFVAPTGVMQNLGPSLVAEEGMTTARQQVGSPLRNTHLSDFDDSKLSPVSTRFESIWLSSPEQSPDRTPIVKTTVTTAPTKMSSSQPFTKKHMPKKDELDETEGRFTMAPPRFSDPQPWTGSLSHVPPTVPNRASQSLHAPPTRPLKTPSPIPPSQQRQTGVVSKSHRSEPASRPDNLRKPPAQQYEDDMATAGHSETVAHTQRYRLQHQDEYQEENEPNDEIRLSSKDEDTLFDFDGNNYSKVVTLNDKNVKVTHKIRRRTRQRRENPVTETDDDTSVENYGTATIPATSLQERTHQAWKSRQKKSSSLRSSSKQDPSQPKAAVSFGKQNTVHHFQPSAHEEYEKRRQEEEDASVDRSLNSEYTKTLESEVEDMIKDILFIGTSDKSKPGRRKYKDRPEVRRRLRQAQQEQLALEAKNAKYESNTDTIESTIEDESTLPSVDPHPAPKVVVDRRSAQQTKKTVQENLRHAALNDSGDSLLSSQAPTRSTIYSDERSSVISASSVDSATVETLQTAETLQSAKDGDPDPFAAVLGFVEGGLSAVTLALGYAFAETDKKPEKLRGREKSIENANDTAQSSGDRYNVFESCLGGGTAIEGGGSELNRPVSSGIVDKLSQDIWQNHVVKKSFSNPSIFMDGTSLSDSVGGSAEVNRQLEALNKDSKVSVLALHAAHSVHKLQGVEYDESIPIDMSKDLKVCPVNLKLPLGIIFVENDGKISFSNALSSVYISFV